MASTELTRLILQRIRELTNPDVSRDEREENLREYFDTLSELRPDTSLDETIQSLTQRLYTRRSQLRETDERLAEINQQLELMIDLDQIQEMIKVLENRLTRVQSLEALTGEQTLVQEYFSMDTRDFNNLTPEMHILFLETMLTPIVKIPVN
ncbi:MAG: hypothetical protein AAFR81_05270, partial [Chloroflexota bacterium]